MARATVETAGKKKSGSAESSGNMVKIVIVIAAFAIAGLGLAYHFGMFEPAPEPQKPLDQILTPEEMAAKEKADKAAADFAKKYNKPPSGS